QCEYLSSEDARAGAGRILQVSCQGSRRAACWQELSNGLLGCLGYTKVIIKMIVVELVVDVVVHLRRGDVVIPQGLTALHVRSHDIEGSRWWWRLRLRDMIHFVNDAHVVYSLTTSRIWIAHFVGFPRSDINDVVGACRRLIVLVLRAVMDHRRLGEE